MKGVKSGEFDPKNIAAGNIAQKTKEVAGKLKPKPKEEGKSNN